MSPDHGPDPPEHAAAERTMLAWHRTRFARQRTTLAFLWPSRSSTGDPPLAGESSEDTRTHLAWQRTWLAQERTHLAWVRTTMNVVGLGLAIIKFGPLSGPDAIIAGALVVLVAMGVLLYSTRRYHQHTRLKANRRGPATAGAALVLAVLTAGLLLVHGHSHIQYPAHHNHAHTNQHRPGQDLTLMPWALTHPRSTS